MLYCSLNEVIGCIFAEHAKRHILGKQYIAGRKNSAGEVNATAGHWLPIPR